MSLERSEDISGINRKGVVTAVMTRFLPGAPLTWMIGLGADAVAAELAGAVDSGVGTAPTETAVK
jgi:hypothetical protein